MADPFETEAKAWMEKAWRDLEMAQRAVGVMPPFYDMAVYHCQQSLHCGGSLHFQSNPLRLDPKSPAFFASPRGGVGPS